MQQQTHHESQQRSGQMSHGARQQGQRFSDVETPQQHQAMQAILEAVETCEWCADQCVQHADPDMVECIRLCEDVSELGETALALVPRRSRYANSVLQTFVQAAQACGQECSRHSHGHCQECSQVLQSTVQSVQGYLSSTGQQGQQSQQFSGYV